MTLPRRRFLSGAAAAVASPWIASGPRAADVARFSLGVASGQPRADGMVLWTRLTGGDLRRARDRALGARRRRSASRGSSPAARKRPKPAWAHSVHAEPVGLAPARWYWYRFSALGERSAVGRTRTAPAADAAATLRFAIASCQRFDVGHYAAWRHVAGADLDLVMFLGDYIYEYATRKDPVRRMEGGEIFTLDQYRARYATYKSDPSLQAAHAAAPWLLVWDDHEVSNDYAGFRGQDLSVDTRARRAAAYRAYWEHMPFPKSARPVDADMRIVGRLDWGRLARIHLLDDRQYRDPQACPRPNLGGSNTVALAQCPALTDPARTLLGTEQEQWLAAGWDLGRPWNLVAQQTLMARFTWLDPAIGGGGYWTDGWDGYAPARNRLLGTVAAKKVPGVVVFGGDVHSNYVADLKADYDDPGVAGRRERVLRHLDHEPVAGAGARRRGARVQPAHPLRPRRPARLHELRARREAAAREPAGRRPARPIRRARVTTAARFVVDAARPGASAA